MQSSAAAQRAQSVRSAGDTLSIQGCKPGSGLGSLIQAWQADDGQRAFIALCTLRQLLQRRAAILARLAAGNADFQNLFVCKQAQGTTRRQHTTPVKVRTHDGVAAALCIALGARRGADGICRLLLLQRLVTMQHIKRTQALGQMRGKLVQRKLHEF